MPVGAVLRDAGRDDPTGPAPAKYSQAFAGGQGPDASRRTSRARGLTADECAAVLAA